MPRLARYMLVKRKAPSPSGHQYRIIKVIGMDSLEAVFTDPTIKVVASYPTLKEARHGRVNQIRKVLSNVNKSFLRKDTKHD